MEKVENRKRVRWDGAFSIHRKMWIFFGFSTGIGGKKERGRFSTGSFPLSTRGLWKHQSLELMLEVMSRILSPMPEVGTFSLLLIFSRPYSTVA